MDKKARAALHALRSAKTNGALDSTEAQLFDVIDGMLRERELAAAAKSEPGGCWIGPFEWRGGPCPLPPGTKVRCETSDGAVTLGDGVSAQCWAWRSLPAPGLSIIRFRYRAPDALGWLDFDPAVWTPPDALFEPDCPVRLEWAADVGHEVVISGERRQSWHGVQHVRLVAREMGNG